VHIRAPCSSHDTRSSKLRYKLDATLLPQTGTGLNVTSLLTNGYLVEKDPAA
jgi:hypothetical protein